MIRNEWTVIFTFTLLLILSLYPCFFFLLLLFYTSLILHLPSSVSDVPKVKLWITAPSLCDFVVVCWYRRRTGNNGRIDCDADSRTKGGPDAGRRTREGAGAVSLGPGVLRGPVALLFSSFFSYNLRQSSGSDWSQSQTWPITAVTEDSRLDSC